MAYERKLGYFFASNSGEFRRFASETEGVSLEQILPKIYLKFDADISVELPNSVDTVLNPYFHQEEVTEYRPYGVGQMMLQTSASIAEPDKITVCVNQVEPGEDEKYPEGYSIWKTYAFYAYRTPKEEFSRALKVLLKEGFHLVG